MVCAERKSLLVDYRDLVRQYADAVRTLVDMISLESSGPEGVNVLSEALNDDIELLRRKCRKAHERAEEARLKLFRHEANHLCDRSDFTSVPV